MGDLILRFVVSVVMTLIVRYVIQREGGPEWAATGFGMIALIVTVLGLRY